MSDQVLSARSFTREQDASGSWTWVVRLAKVLSLLLTVVVCCIAGAAVELGSDGREVARDPSLWVHGLAYAGLVFAILAARELVRASVLARTRGSVSLPWFLPAPGFAGTLGSVAGGEASAAASVGAVLAGFAVSAALLTWGIHQTVLDAVAPVGSAARQFALPAVARLIQAALQTPSDVAQFQWHAALYAGWTGVLLTGVSLIPGGRFDGAQILSAVLPTWGRVAGTVLCGVLVGVGVVTKSLHWLVWPWWRW